MTPQIEISIAAFFLAVGMAGTPLEAIGIFAAAVICALVTRSGKFVGALAMVATIAGGYLQHHEFRLSLLIAATALGVAAHLLYRRPRATTALMALSAVTGLAFLFFG